MNKPDSQITASFPQSPKPAPTSDRVAGSEPGEGSGDSDIPEDPRIIQLVQEYLAELELGRTPNRAAYLNRYPELSDAVSQCLDGLEMVHGGVASSSSARRARVGVLPPPGLDARSALGDFQIIREVARGGMGIVYEAVQLSLGRRVALKVLPFAATLDERQLQRFKNEAQAAAVLHHTHIVPIYAVGCERGVHFYAMQLIDGQSLAEVIKQLREESGLKPTSDGSLDYSSYVLTEGNIAPPAPRALLGGEQAASQPASNAPHRSTNVSAAVTAGGSPASEIRFRRIARLMVQAAEALDHAHQLGVVHRDVKPANLLINAAGNLWVTDFGLAQFQADNGLTRSGDILGTFRYMSPEQTIGQRATLDHRTDIYSLGATFYELLTLETVFDGETRQALLYQILQTEPRAPRTVNKAIPPELETILLKCLSKSPADRYGTAADLAADLQRYLDHQPILARRPTLLDRARKWSRRHPAVVAAGVLLLVVITVALSISNRLISQEQQKTSDALAREKQRANEAEASFRQAREIVDTLIEVSETELADHPAAHGTRRRLLEIALGYYQEFIEQRRGDAADQDKLAADQARVKRILYELTVLQREINVGMLENTRVQEALHLAPEQKARLDDLLKGWSAERTAIFTETQALDEDARRQRFVRMAEEHDRALAEALSEQQRQRVKQIVIQAQGLFAFKDSEIVKALDLTVEQRKAVRDIEREIFAQGGGGGPPMRRGPGENRGPGPPRINRQESVARVVAILTDEQRGKWQELVGEPFAGFDEPPFRGPGGFGPPQERRGPPPERPGEIRAPPDNS